MIAASLILAAALVSQEPARAPLSPGAVLLLGNAKDPATTSDALQAALLSADPSARLAAARVIAVVRHGDLRGALIGAIAREQNAVVGAEMIRDLLMLSGAADVDTVAPQVRRFGGDAVFVLAEWLAREQPDEFIKRHDEFVAVGGVWPNGFARIAEMAALQHPADAERIRAAWNSSWATGGPNVPARASTLISIAPGLIESTLKEANCALDHDGGVAVADVVYADDGRPARITADPAGLSPGCWSAWSALARTAVAPPQQPALPDAVETLVLPLDSTVVRCLDDRELAPTATAFPERTNGTTLKPPRKKKNVSPVFPESARHAGVQGAVLIDAVIAKTGCVSQARVVRSVRGLDIAALDAVSQWVFDPLTVDGVPTPVLMTVTVTFSLR